MRQIVALCVLVVCAGGCGSEPNNAGPDLSIPPPDLSLSGVICGSTSCAGETGDAECCVDTNGTGSAQCVFPGRCTYGAIFYCDGREDCNSFQFCCGTLTFGTDTNPDAGVVLFEGGKSVCAVTCDFNVTQIPPYTLTTPMCHFDDECRGVTSASGQQVKCCSSTMTPGLHFCAVPMPGVTCP
jgi:hypothetical protein